MLPPHTHTLLSEGRCPLQRLDSINEDIIMASRRRLDHIRRTAANPPTQCSPGQRTENTHKHTLRRTQTHRGVEGVSSVVSISLTLLISAE